METAATAYFSRGEGRSWLEGVAGAIIYKSPEAWWLTEWLGGGSLFSGWGKYRLTIHYAFLDRGGVDLSVVVAEAKNGSWEQNCEGGKVKRYDK